MLRRRSRVRSPSEELVSSVAQLVEQRKIRLVTHLPVKVIFHPKPVSSKTGCRQDYIQ